MEAAGTGAHRTLWAMRRLVALCIALVALFAVFWVVQPIDKGDVRDLVHSVGVAAAPTFVVLAGLLGAALVPGPLLAGASGLLFGTWSGFVVTLAAAVVSALIGCWIGARAARRSPVRDAGIAVAVRRHPLASVVVQRLLPAIPDGPFNYAFGVAGVPAWPLVVGTLIGSSPRAFAYTALGDSLDDPWSPLVIVAAGIVVVTSAVGALVALRMRRAG
jgi:uncharacterized membrane protein YdjX (TVP38/TMEM64 family)